MKKMARGKVATVLMYTYPYSEGPIICELQRERVKDDAASRRRRKQLTTMLVRR